MHSLSRVQENTLGCDNWRPINTNLLVHWSLKFSFSQDLIIFHRNFDLEIVIFIGYELKVGLFLLSSLFQLLFSLCNSFELNFSFLLLCHETNWPSLLQFLRSQLLKPSQDSRIIFNHVMLYYSLFNFGPKLRFEYFAIRNQMRNNAKNELFFRVLTAS